MLWVLFVFIIPVIGVLAYLIVRGGSMHERAAKQAQRQQEAFNSYVSEVAGTSTTDQLAKLADLKERGVPSPMPSSRPKRPRSWPSRSLSGIGRTAM